jgi:hypothetical protein
MAPAGTAPGPISRGTSFPMIGCPGLSDGGRSISLAIPHASGHPELSIALIVPRNGASMPPESQAHPVPTKLPNTHKPNNLRFDL